MKRNHKIIALVCLLLMLPCFMLPVSANSAQHDWSGRDEIGVMTVDGDCPLVVEHETLTFDLQEFPDYRYPDYDIIASYSGRVSAEYTFYNPSDMTVTARMAFPMADTFQTYPRDYADYKITVNGQEIDAEMRHTLTYYNLDFDIDVDLPLLQDDYISDDFFTSGDLPVTKYTITMPSFEGGEYWGGPRCGIDVSVEDYPNTVFYFPSLTGFHVLDEGACRVYSNRVYDHNTFTYYAIGEEPSKLPQVKVYYDWHCRDDEVLGVGETTTKTDTLTLNELIFKDYDESRGISRMDWYNANINVLQNWRKNRGSLVRISDFTDWSGPQLTTWYFYEITFAPGERIVNKVSAPIYPDVNTWNKPTNYNYTYLLSPASTWADFGTLDIYVNTPYYIHNSSLYGFEDTDKGYELHRDGLPKDLNGEYAELTFTLKTEPPTLNQPANDIFNFIMRFIYNIIGRVADFIKGLLN